MFFIYSALLMRDTRLRKRKLLTMKSLTIAKLACPEAAPDVVATEAVTIHKLVPMDGPWLADRVLLVHFLRPEIFQTSGRSTKRVL
jgi:hypothetical protein